MRTAFLSVFVLLAMLCYGQSTKIQIQNGWIEGAISGNDIRSYKGIPFAAPPVGDLRWRAPQPVKNWKSVKKCTAFSASPMQSAPQPFMFWGKPFLIPEEPISEDCLYLNVWTGAKTSTEKRPVIVYIYGGGFRSGGSACPIYDGEAMASKGVVFVSLNYRVGLFGFLAHPELSAESALHSSGNYALLDMIAGLLWVKDNIEAFGGDPANVTIAGQSAGSFAVNYLTAAPMAKGLFQKAIAESGADFYGAARHGSLDLSAAEQLGSTFAAGLHAQNIDALRKISATELMAATGGLQWPIIDGVVIPETIMQTYQKGQQIDVPLLTGWNADDRLFLEPATAADFRDQIEKRFGEDWARQFLSVYPSRTDTESAISQIAASRDEAFGIQNFTWAGMQTNTGKSPVYLYNFNRRLPAYADSSDFGAFHSAEIPYAYDNLSAIDRPWTSADRQLAALMSAYWVNFARSGNPNGVGLPHWEAFNKETEPVMLLDSSSRSVPLPHREQLLFWERFYREQPAAGKGTVELHYIESKALQNNGGEDPRRRISVYLPPGYAVADEHYPVIYYLHGFMGTDSIYPMMKARLDEGIAAKKIRPFILVIPNEYTLFEGSFYSNSSLTGDWDTFTSTELVAYMDAHFRTIANRNGRGIAGHSMGGYGAIRMAMGHPDVFSSLYALSPGLLAFVKEFGPNSNSFKEVQQVESVEALRKTYYPKVLVACGRAWSPNPDKPPFYCDFPFTYEADSMLVNQPVLEKWYANMPFYMLDKYADNLRQLKAIKLDWGRNDAPRFPLQIGMFSQGLENRGIEHQAEEYIGTHGNKIWTEDGRVLNDLLPFFNDHLSFE